MGTVGLFFFGIRVVKWRSFLSVHYIGRIPASERS